MNKTQSKEKKKEEVVDYSKLGKLGGKATLKKHGKEYFKKIAKKRWRKKRANSK